MSETGLVFRLLSDIQVPIVSLGLRLGEWCETTTTEHSEYVFHIC